MAKILITGGSGLVGTHLSHLLSSSGHQVRHLSRSHQPNGDYPTFLWDIQNQTIDEKAFDGLDHIIHLAGAGVADQKWTDKRKQIILDSRVDGIKLLHHYAEKLNLRLKSFISASAIGYYGLDTGDRKLDELKPPGSDFLAEVVKSWEAEADTFQSLTQVAKVRIGVVLSAEGGAMTEIMKPIKFYAGAPLGNGDQYMSWIHIEDLCRIFQFVLEEEIEGTYNAAAPNPVTNEALTKSLARALNKPLILPNVPGFVLKLMLGEMAQMVQGGNYVLSDKIREKGFKFNYTNIDSAVKNLLT
ncbi:MAG: TIGR01777 family oxidoreductase [Marinoscillum sp.]